MRISFFCASAFLCGSLLAADNAPGELLRRIREKMTQHLAELPNYTCREVIDRTVRRGAEDAFRPVDEVRLQVAFVAGREMYAKDAKHRFAATHIQDLVPGGSSGNGDFGMHARVLFGGDAAEIHYAGKEKHDHRRAYRFDFTVPLTTSQFVLSGKGTQQLVPYHGSFWADAGTLDMIEIKVEVTKIPAGVQLRRVEQSIRYGRITVGKSSFLLPRNAELVTEDIYGNAAHNYTMFDQCQEYVGDSIVRYGPVVPSQGSAARSADPE